MARELKTGERAPAPVETPVPVVAPKTGTLDFEAEQQLRMDWNVIIENQEKKLAEAGAALVAMRETLTENVCECIMNWAMSPWSDDRGQDIKELTVSVEKMIRQFSTPPSALLKSHDAEVRALVWEEAAAIEGLVHAPQISSNRGTFLEKAKEARAAAQEKP